jgi:hypothetical protein
MYIEHTMQHELKIIVLYYLLQHVLQHQLERELQHSLKGIFQPFELGGETGLIRFDVKY